MKTIIRTLTLGVLSLFCLVCHFSEGYAAEQLKTPSGGSGDRLLITGSSTMCPMIAEIGKRFESLHHDAHIHVECGGSERGIKDVLEGAAAIGMVSRVLSNEDGTLISFPIARDGVSIVVHKSNPVKALSNAQVVGIYTGRLTNWKDTDCPNAAITVLRREKQKSSTELFMNYFKLKETEMKGTVVIGDNPVTINALAANRYAIGYVSSGHAEHDAAAGVPIKILPVDRVMPTRRNIITGNYPISRPLTLVTARLPTGLAKDFIDFALSSSVVDIIEKFNFVPYQD